MNTFTFVLVCFQACLVQNAFSQCTSRAAVATEPGLLAPAGLYNSYGLTAPALASGLASPYNMAAPALSSYGLAAPYGAAIAPAAAAYAPYEWAGVAPYGGVGEGNVAVAGELPVAGNTAVAGQVPIMGAVNFSGAVPAAGAVSIAGQCACGCGAPYEYLY